MSKLRARLQKLFSKKDVAIAKEDRLSEKLICILCDETRVPPAFTELLDLVPSDSTREKLNKLSLAVEIAKRAFFPYSGKKVCDDLNKEVVEVEKIIKEFNRVPRLEQSSKEELEELKLRRDILLARRDVMTSRKDAKIAIYSYLSLVSIRIETENAKLLTFTRHK